MQGLRPGRHANLRTVDELVDERVQAIQPPLLLGLGD
jgi:hypothetical protein